MKKHDYTVRTAVSMFATIIGFFLLMKVLGLEHITELRFFNILIVAFYSNKLAKQNVEDQNKIEYLHGLRTIFAANALNVILSVGALLLYIAFVEPNFLTNFENGFLIGSESSMAKVCTGLFMEGMAGSAIISFTLMQYWKDVTRTTKKIDLTQ